MPPAPSPTPAAVLADQFRALVMAPVPRGSNDREVTVGRWFDTLSPEDAVTLLARLEPGAPGRPAGDLWPLLSRSGSGAATSRLLTKLRDRVKARFRGTLDRGTANRIAGAAHRGIERDPAQDPRCRLLTMRKVPDSYSAFEADIMAWMATCVQSRTRDSHREVPLVRGNASLVALYPQLVRGRPARIVPSYLWGPDRVEHIGFSSPDVVSAAPTSPGPTATRPGPAVPSAPPSAPAVPNMPLDPSKITVKPPPIVIKTVDPGFDDDDSKILDTPRKILRAAKKLAELLRKQGEYNDATELEKLAKEGLSQAVTIALIIGGFYLAVNYLGGRILFQWTWTAGSTAIEAELLRRLARAKTPISELEDTLDKIITIAKRHPDLAGAADDDDWKALRRTFDPSIPVQIDDVACGPACVQIALSDRGIAVAQKEIADLVRVKGLSPMANLDDLARVLRQFDPRGDWHSGAVEIGSLGPREIARFHSTKGSWIALVKTRAALPAKHLVVVQSFDGNVVVLADPWRTDQLVGRRIEMLWTEFQRIWAPGAAKGGGTAVFPLGTK